MSNKIPPILLALAIVIGTIAAGCGGGSDEATGSQSLDRAEFVQKANAECRKERAGLSKEVREFMVEERPRGFPRDLLLWRLAHYILLPTIENEITKVRLLGPPLPDKAGIEAGLSAERSAVDRVATAGRLASMTAFNRYFAESGAELRANRLNACTNDHKSQQLNFLY